MEIEDMEIEDWIVIRPFRVKESRVRLPNSRVKTKKPGGVLIRSERAPGGANYRILLPGPMALLPPSRFSTPSVDRSQPDDLRHGGPA
jgi:hypothetical protein